MITNLAAESQRSRPMAARRESSLKKNEKRVHLGSNYLPGHNVVICGRGKSCTSSPGNKKLRAYVDSFAKSYGAASNKEQKSKIVTTIIQLIEEPEGGAFVKFEESTWWKVDEAYAREKIGNLFRDVLHTKYRSSSKAKQARKHKAASVSCGFNDEIKSIATKLSMDQSYSSSCTSGNSSNHNMCHWNNSNNNMDCGSNHGVLGPSSFGIPLQGVMSSMSCGMPTNNSFHHHNDTMTYHSQHPFERRNILLNYCNEALNITSSDATRMSRAALYGNNVPDMASFNNMMMASAACRNSVEAMSAAMTVTPDKTGSSWMHNNGKKKTSSKVSEDGDKHNNDDDEVSLATFAGDDDIFSDFLVENVDDLSRIF